MHYAYLFKDVFFDINLLHILLNSLAIGLVCFFFASNTVLLQQIID